MTLVMLVGDTEEEATIQGGYDGDPKRGVLRK